MLRVRQVFSFTTNERHTGRAKSNLLYEARLCGKRSNRVGRNSPETESFDEVQRGIRILQQRQEVVRTIFLEEKIVKRRVPKFPGVHEEPADLPIVKIQSILPDIAIFDVPIFLHLQVIGDGGDCLLYTSI